MTAPTHLRFAEATAAEQQVALCAIVRASPLLMGALTALRRLGLPDALIASGAIYNTVWNVLTGRPPLTGIKDIDIAYFDGTDLSWEAEDAVIHCATPAFADLPVPVEIRNQARVHLWFPEKFGTPYPQLSSSADMLTRFASRTHAVAVRLEPDDSLTLFAPYGLADLFAFRITPNPVLDNRLTHETKAARAKAIWPELTVVPWERQKTITERTNGG
jgi:hypothetical protein